MNTRHQTYGKYFLKASVISYCLVHQHFSVHFAFLTGELLNSLPQILKVRVKETIKT